VHFKFRCNTNDKCCSRYMYYQEGPLVFALKIGNLEKGQDPQRTPYSHQRLLAFYRTYLYSSWEDVEIVLKNIILKNIYLKKESVT